MARRKPTRFAFPSGVMPTGPDLRPIRALHRGQCGFICFASLATGKWKEWFTELSTIETIFPQFADELIQDSYFSINTFHGKRRQNESACWLNACFVDVDCGDADDLGRRLGAVFAKADKGELPKPSYVVFSGRGFWLLWVLRHDDGPVPGVWLNRILYDQIERELVERCQSDPKAKDIARVMRVPGSRNSKAGGAYVRFERLAGQDAEGRGYEYSLEQLIAILGLKRPELRPVKQLKGGTGKRSSNPRGHVAVWNLRYEAFNQLRQLRGGAFHEGCRYNACLLLAIMTWRMGITRPDVERDVLALARQCRPPLPEGEARNALAGAFKSSATKTLFREETIMKWLNVTADERAKIFRWRETVNTTIRPCSPSERQAVIAKVIDHLGFRPPLRLMRRELRSLGISACVETIAKDYRKLTSRRRIDVEDPPIQRLLPERGVGMVDAV